MTTRRGFVPVGVILVFALMVTPALAGSTSRVGTTAAAQATWVPGNCNGGVPPWTQHPNRIYITCDGTAVIEGLRWHGWDGATAHATGTLNDVSSCTPNCAQAPRHHYAVQLLASGIGYCGTRRVYDEIVLHYTGPKQRRRKPFTEPTYCSTAYPREKPTSSPPTAQAPSSPTGFRVRLTAGLFLCAITLSGNPAEGVVVAGGAFCLSHGSPSAESNWHAANVQPDGQVTDCSEEASIMRADCYSGQGNDIGLPYLSPGQQTVVGPFTCKVLEGGVECIVTATGKGFLITPIESVPVGG
jgi:hypothetical protein